MGDIMRKFSFPIAIFLVFVLPVLLSNLLSTTKNNNVVPEPIAKEADVLVEPIIVKDDSTITTMELETYLLRVLLGEVPASFEEEALKAQAVASRTYTLRKLQNQTKHKDADICTDAACCQAYLTEAMYLMEKGKLQDVQKMEKALSDTKGQVLTYQGELIEATYFSSSGGMTEDAVAVWGTSVPYLKSVSSPEQEGNAYYGKETKYTLEVFLTTLGLPKDMPLTLGDIEITHTTGGGVDQIVINGSSYSGTQLRSLLKLPSTAMMIQIVDETVIITTNGNGHRVGMSQYGADAMAVSGNTYDKILLHYYPGTQLVTLRTEQIKGMFDKA